MAKKKAPKKAGKKAASSKVKSAAKQAKAPSAAVKKAAEKALKAAKKKPRAAVTGPPEIIAVQKGNKPGKPKFTLERCQKVRILGRNFSPTVKVHLSVAQGFDWVPFAIADVPRNLDILFKSTPPFFEIVDMVEVCAVPLRRFSLSATGLRAAAIRPPGAGPDDDVTVTISNDPPTPTGNDTATSPAEYSNP